MCSAFSISIARRCQLSAFDLPASAHSWESLGIHRALRRPAQPVTVRRRISTSTSSQAPRTAQKANSPGHWILKAVLMADVSPVLVAVSV